MRNDMSKVLIERPRWGHSDPSKKTGRRLRGYDPHDEYEDLPQREPASKGRGTKAFTDLLGPLKKFLQSRIGQPWDKIYSELCAQLDRRKTTGLHVFQHLEDYVEVNCFIGDDGEVYARTKWHGVRRIGAGGWHRCKFFVHPNTGLLSFETRRLSKHEKETIKRAERKKIERLQISYSQSYVRINGVWYVGDYLEEDPPLKHPKLSENIHRSKCQQIRSQEEKAAEDFGTRYWNGKHWMQLIGKRKCSQQELQKAGLKNVNPSRQ